MRQATRKDAEADERRGEVRGGVRKMEKSIEGETQDS